MRILIDMDEVMDNLREVWVDCIKKKYGKRAENHIPEEWDIKKGFPDLTEEEAYEPLYTDEVWDFVGPVPGCVECLKKLQAEGHELYILTGLDCRHLGMDAYKNLTNKMDTVYRKYFSFIPADNVIVTSHKQMVQGDVLTDDAPWNLEGGSYRKILFATQCNARYDAEAHGMERADGWADVYRIIQSIKKERESV